MEDSTNILVVDHDRTFAEFIAQYLSEHCYPSKVITGLSEMYEVLRSGEVDLIILDVDISSDGLTVCKQLRDSSEIPIILIIGSDKKADRITGLEIGADDCVTNPFNPRELLARVKAVLRRAGVENWTDQATALDSAKSEELVWTFSDYRLIAASRTLILPDGHRIDLRRSEYELLAAFLAHPNRVLTHSQLADLTGCEPSQPLSRALDVQICRLREKIEADPHNPALIETVRGSGYMLSAKVVMHRAEATAS